MSEGRSEPAQPWFERNSVLWLAGIIVGFGFLLLQPFITPDWPKAVKTWLSYPVMRALMYGATGAALFVTGHIVGRRRRSAAALAPAGAIASHVASLPNAQATALPKAPQVSAPATKPDSDVSEPERRALVKLHLAGGSANAEELGSSLGIAWPTFQLVLHSLEAKDMAIHSQGSNAWGSWNAVEILDRGRDYLVRLHKQDPTIFDKAP